LGRIQQFFYAKLHEKKKKTFQFFPVTYSPKAKRLIMELFALPHQKYARAGELNRTAGNAKGAPRGPDQSPVFVIKVTPAVSS
jgi:hypothetical protein